MTSANKNISESHSRHSDDLLRVVHETPVILVLGEQPLPIKGIPNTNNTLHSQVDKRTSVKSEYT